ncbi:MAG: 50S ribosomal protein L9 [Candidatus Atribacteria bacterium]|nr:50S ribosomal protein L9 [Candidatus Atribacteria bacterium]
MKLILLQKVDNLGDEGDVIEVKEGYARNYLLPKKLAFEATKGSLTQIDILKRKRKQREEKELDALRQLQKKVDGMRLEFVRKAGDKGKLYGSVTSKEIAEKIGEILQLELDRKFIDLPEPIKDVGKTEVKLHFGKGIYGSVQVQIIPEESVRPDDSKEVKES